jgi:hypothetical protein
MRGREGGERGVVGSGMIEYIRLCLPTYLPT